ncbi:hypothetical protein WJX79_004447 [Trebouxia sp. C0005]
MQPCVNPSRFSLPGKDWTAIRQAPAGPPNAQLLLVCTSKSCKWAQVRFQDGALPGTYFGPNDQCAESIEIQFQIGTDDELGIHVPVGSSLLQAAELSGAVKPNRDFCFEGSCELCQLEVKDGAQELGPKAQHGVQELVRSCLTAVPRRQNGLVHVKVLSEESVWAEGVL